MADEFIKLAESKGLNSETIEVLQEQAINNADDLTLLSDDDIKKLKLKIAQTNLLKKWIEEIKGESGREFHLFYNIIWQVYS